MEAIVGKQAGSGVAMDLRCRDIASLPMEMSLPGKRSRTLSRMTILSVKFRRASGRG